MKRRWTGERPVSFGPRSWCDVPAATSNAQPAPRVTRLSRAGARCLWEGDAALMLAACARCVASVVIGSRHSKRGCAGKKPLSFGARLWCDVPVTPPNAKTRSAVAPPLADSGEEAQQANLLYARASPRWLRSGRVPRMGAVPAKGLPPLARYCGATCQLRLIPILRFAPLSPRCRCSTNGLRVH